MKHIHPALLLLLVSCALPGFAQVSSQTRAVTINSAVDVVNQWTPTQHLYVKGDLGVSPERLSALEAWLHDHAPHWTVVLMHDVVDERFTTADGRRFVGLDAVDHALGHGLANRTAFGELEHPQTHERDGAVFALFLRERDFSYYGSDAQDRRSLGESHWVGELDRPAFRAMRGGGRIVDAVKDTINTINSRLEQVILEEEAARQRAAQTRRQAMAQAQAQIHVTQTNIDQVQEHSAKVLQQFPNATGALTTPTIEAWTKSLEEIQRTISDDNVHAMSQRLTTLNDEVEGMLNSYAIHQGMQQQASELNDQINALVGKTGGAAHAKQAAVLLQQAQLAHTNGDSQLKRILTEVEETLRSGAAAVAAEHKRVQQKWARRRLVRNATLAIVAVAAVVLAFVAVLLNRRRRPSKLAAEKAFAEREASVKAEMDRVLKLFERSNEVLGDKKQLAQRGYQGRTQALSDQTLTHIDELLIMSGEVERVMGEARELIHPSDPMYQAINAISAARYERGINRVSGEPLHFNQDSGIPLVLRNKRERAQDNEEPKEITLTFAEVFDAFHQRCESASESLDIVASSLLQVGDAIDELQIKIDDVSDVDRQLAMVAAEDDYFQLPALFESLIPSAQADVDQADRVAGLDPVQAMQLQLPAGNRKMDDAREIMQLVSSARKQLFPELREHTPRLEQMSYRTRWIEDRLASLGQRANALLSDAVIRAVKPNTQALGQDIAALGEDVRHCVAMGKHLLGDHHRAIDDLQQRISAVRARISAALDIPPEALLQEPQASAAAHLADARHQVTAVEAAINIGNVASAVAATEALQNHVHRGIAIVDESLQMLEQFAERSKSGEAHFHAVERLLENTSQLLTELRRRYAESALYFRAAGNTDQDANATVHTQLEQCQRTLDASRRVLDESTTLFRTGKMLATDQSLCEAEAAIDKVERMVEVIDDHVGLLNRYSSENSTTFRKLLAHFDNLDAQMRDDRTTRRTMDSFEHTKHAIEQSTGMIQDTGGRRDPFLAHEEITALQQRSAEMDAMIVADRNAHAEASRAVLGAEAELTAAAALVSRAGRDNIPDSAATSDAIAELRKQESFLRDVRRRLESPHEDWADVAKHATQVNAELGKQAGRLRGELSRAAQCVEALRRASREVSAAAGYSGGFGVLVRGTPGVDDLESARRALAGGDYAHMLQLAGAAEVQARQAIMQAQRRIAERKREAARRAEAARRKRQQIQSHVFGRSGSSGRSSSSSRPSSSPSRSYKNSGFSRSGW